MTAYAAPVMVDVTPMSDCASAPVTIMEILAKVNILIIVMKGTRFISMYVFQNYPNALVMVIVMLPMVNVTPKLVFVSATITTPEILAKVNDSINMFF